MIIPDRMTSAITLHGLGFVQIQLQAEQRLHVWHPELPRRHCFEHSAIHNHRFDFISRILVGEQININYINAAPSEAMKLEPTHTLYLHEGPRSPRGGRPWMPDGQVSMVESSRNRIYAGDAYTMRAYDYHSTQPGNSGKVATIMTKGWEGKRGAHSSCVIGTEPDDDFDRFQWSPAQLWDVVMDVLSQPGENKA